MTKQKRNRARSRRKILSSANTFSSRAEGNLFVQAWCGAIERMSMQQLRDRGHRMLDLWYSSVDGSNSQMNKSEDWESITSTNLPPLLKSLAKQYKPRRLPKTSPLMRRIDWLVENLEFDAIEHTILLVVARCAVHDEWDQLVTALTGRNTHLTARSIASISGGNVSKIETRLAEGARLWTTGFVHNDGDGEFRASSLLERLARTESPPSQLTKLLMPKAQRSSLTWPDFDHVGPLRDIAKRLVASDAGTGILLYGPPGTGKTEFARLLADQTGKKAIFAGSSNGSGDEPSRENRLSHLTVLRALTKGDPSKLVVMDEADDVLCLWNRSRGWTSKLFINQIVESGERPTIWILNEPEVLEESLLRRMGLAIEFPKPSLKTRSKIVELHARSSRLKLQVNDVAKLAALPAAPAVIGNALKGAKAIGGGAEEALAIGEGLVTAVCGRPPAADTLPPIYDPSLALADLNLDTLSKQLVSAPNREWSLLLSGPSGTGKSAYARHLADRMGAELIVRRGSDLLGMFVGETEAKIAAAFHEAHRSKGLLLIDEADDFLSDRREATRSWERSMVNEMLRQMEELRAPFVATTNLVDRLDPATQRRFTLRATFRSLDHKRAADQFRKWFRTDVPGNVSISGATPGDFALVAKRAALVGEDAAAVLAGWLADEIRSRGGTNTVLGF